MYPNLPELPIFIPILIAMAVCGIVGLVNGLVVSKFNVPPFIATLGMMTGIYGLNSIYFDRPPYGAMPIGGLSQSFSNFTLGSIPIYGNIKIPYLVIYAIIVIAVIWTLWNKTKFGKTFMP